MVEEGSNEKCSKDLTLKIHLKVNLISLTMFLMLSHAMLGKLNSIIKT
jgi:hypothetical protein